MGIDCIFIGINQTEIPAIVVLQDDMQTIIVTELTQKVSKGLPRGEVKLGTMIKSIFSSPFRDGLSILYVSQNTVKFSSNRLDENPVNDFTLLKN